ncbi:MAG: hypothetical protein HRU33_21015 [Rhodobacteraceae bacterium]|nr:hypothetical protein [Paracoccaceae bacterium]
MKQELTITARLPDWRPRLSAYLAENGARAFRPGFHDCALFAAGAVEAMTGTDAAAQWRGTYRSLEDGQSLLQRAGYSDHVALVAAYLSEVHPSQAAVGDLAALPGSDGRPALGVVQGASVYVLQPSGMALVNRLQIERAFRV